MKKKVRHSTTLYTPRRHNDFLVRAVRARAEAIFGNEDGLGKVSKYFWALAREDLKKAGLLRPDGEPDPDKLFELESHYFKAETPGTRVEQEDRQG